jgi:hypothetical protein
MLNVNTYGQVNDNVIMVFGNDKCNATLIVNAYGQVNINVSCFMVMIM